MTDLSTHMLSGFVPSILPGVQAEAVPRTPLIRTAKLIGENGEFPCVLREIAGDTLRVRLYCDPPLGETRFKLEFGEGDQYRVQLVWHKDDSAGLRFCDYHDLFSLVSDKGPFRKRAIRIAVKLPASFQLGGQTYQTTILDISHQGARIETEEQLPMDQQLRLSIPALGDVYARVRWRRHPQYGLALVETFRFEEIAYMAGSFHALSHLFSGNPGQVGAA